MVPVRTARRMRPSAALANDTGRPNLHHPPIPGISFHIFVFFVLFVVGSFTLLDDIDARPVFQFLALHRQCDALAFVQAFGDLHVIAGTFAELHIFLF